MHGLDGCLSASPSPWPLALPRPRPSNRPLQTNEMSATKIDFELEGYAAASNVRGTVFLKTIGIDPADLTRDIVILDCFYLGLALLAFAMLYLVMPRHSRLRGGAAPGAAEGGCPLPK